MASTLRPGSIDEEHLRTLGEIAAAQPDEVLDRIVTVALRSDLWSALLPLATQLPTEAPAQVADRARALPGTDVSDDLRSQREGGRTRR